MFPINRESKRSDGNAKKRKIITMDEKVEIIKRAERGERPSQIGKTMGYGQSTISTIVKDKVRIMEHVRGSVSMNSTIITKKRSGLLIEMERLLMIWIEDQNQRCVPIGPNLIREKARMLYEDLKEIRGEQGESSEQFSASKGWFNRFIVRSNMYHAKVAEEATSVDVSAAKKFLKVFSDIIQDGDYCAEQVFNVTETGLNWKKMPDHTHIAREENSMPGHKASKEKLTLLFGGNAAGDCKLKPLLVYHSKNPSALKGILKAALPVIWKSNKKAWVTLDMFSEWFLNNFVPEVERYCIFKNLPFKILLLLDNMPCHPSTLDDIHPNVKVVFLPPNTSSLIQPMDQGVTKSFKIYYIQRIFSQAVWAIESGEKTFREFWKSYSIYDAIKNIANSWNEINAIIMSGAWKKLCPQRANSFEGLCEDAITKARENVLSLGRDLNLEISDDDITSLLDSQIVEVSNEDLTELDEKILQQEEVESDVETPEPRQFKVSELANAFRLIEAGMAKFEEQDPNAERFTNAYRDVTEAIRCYKDIYEERKKLSV